MCEASVSQTVLVIDDDPVMRVLLRTFLEAAGYTVVEADDGRNGLARAADVRPDAVMVDSRMPGMAGGEVVRLLRDGTTTCDLAIVLMSGAGTQADVAAALAAGADRYLTKPLAPESVFAALRGALAARRPGEADT